MMRLDLTSFTRALRATTPVGDDDNAFEPRRYKYARLAQLSLLDTYYNAAEDACPDFVCWPTPTTADLMHDVGLLLRKGPTGFSVLYDQRRREGLLDYLRAQYAEPPEDVRACCPDPHRRTGQPGVWTRLSFVLALQNPQFLNFTDLPIGLSPSRLNFYFTNQEAHRQRNLGLLLNPGPYVRSPVQARDMPKPGVSQLLPVVDGQYPVPMGFGDALADCVRVLDVRGEVVCCKPRCVTREHDVTRAPETHCVDQQYLDFSVLPLGRYQIQWLVGEQVARSLTVLYTDTYPIPLAFVDLFITDPSVLRPPSATPPDDSGLFPVRNLWSDKPEVVGLNYRLRFRRRATTWNYYVVSARELQDLRIEGSAGFSGPTRVTLANGKPAYRFVSEESLAIEQRSRYRLALYGTPADSARDTALYDPLPLAAPAQVLAERAPHVGLATASRADVYVYL